VPGNKTEELLKEALENLKKEEAQLLKEIDELYEQLKSRQIALEFKQRKINALQWAIQATPDNVTSLSSFEEDGFTSRSPRDIKDNIADILAEQNGELHYKHIYDKLLSRGIRIPGKDPLQNLLSYLSRDERFVRVDKGTYTLTEEAFKQYRPAL
jgi:seryl-tRNA synthetase